jgi:hypothetical protein
MLFIFVSGQIRWIVLITYPPSPSPHPLPPQWGAAWAVPLEGGGGGERIRGQIDNEDTGCVPLWGERGLVDLFGGREGGSLWWFVGQEQ